MAIFGQPFGSMFGDPDKAIADIIYSQGQLSFKAVSGAGDSFYGIFVNNVFKQSVWTPEGGYSQPITALYPVDSTVVILGLGQMTQTSNTNPLLYYGLPLVFPTSSWYWAVDVIDPCDNMIFDIELDGLKIIQTKESETQTRKLLTIDSIVTGNNVEVRIGNDSKVLASGTVTLPNTTITLLDYLDDPNNEVKTIPDDGEDGDIYGVSVSFSGDYAVVGASGDTNLGIKSGSAYIFHKNEGGIDNWGEVKKITASDGYNGDKFGCSVSIDGNYIVVGAFGDDVYTGSAYVFQKDEGGTDNWGEVKKIIASDGTNYYSFGDTVSISNDNIVVGSYGNDTYTGAAYVFNKDEGGTNNWGEVKKITASAGVAYDFFGGYVSIDNSIIAVGTFGDDSYTGATYIFNKDEGGTNNWGEVKKIIGSDSADGDNFGYPVSVQNNTLVVGAYYNAAFGANAGAAYVFNKDEGGTDNWGEVKRLSVDDISAGSLFGSGVSVNDNYIIVGAYGDESLGYRSGAAYIFRKDEGGINNWGNISKITPSGGGIDDFFGFSVDISDDFVIVGSPYYGADDIGSASIFDKTSSIDPSSSGVTGTCEIDPAIVSSSQELEVRYPSNMHIYRDGTVVARVSFNNQDTGSWQETEELDVGIYYYKMAFLSDTDDLGDFTIETPLTVEGYPDAVTNLEYVSGDYSNTIVSFTPSDTVNATYNVYVKKPSDIYFDTVTPTSTLPAGSTSVNLPAMEYAGTSTILIRAEFAGFIEQNINTLDIEYDDAGNKVVLRPNNCSIRSVDVSDGNTISVSISYDSSGELGIATSIELYKTTCGETYDLDDPIATATIPTVLSAIKPVVITVDLNLNDTFYLVCRAKTDEGGYSKQTPNEYEVFVSDINLPSPIGAFV